ncbi:hypothetical protein K450DRAFT_242133 [Umbelopsis ramanniana AG]|uniref:Uncharacterized protein n=1 Tax=Umbelopsis ramanniana AG TaxID=1314678 RepID=A0AAD5EBY7_UMBRA|nr:uncharacterized protein K450DRAFT_242133 [Umbelopsis ramanniana AG]KAI8579430.1 hypothetical protein K450DRAFT_242133 [Umbelopsis ramanniana AG]
MSSFTNKIAIFSTLKPPALPSLFIVFFQKPSGCRSPATSCRKGHSLRPMSLCILPHV